MTNEEKIALYEERIDAIENVLAGKASVDVKQYEINGRSIEKHSMSELISLVDFFQTKLTKLKMKTRPRKVLTRFV